MIRRTNLTVNDLIEVLNANPQGCNQYGCKKGTGAAKKGTGAAKPRKVRLTQAELKKKYPRLAQLGGTGPNGRITKWDVQWEEDSIAAEKWAKSKAGKAEAAEEDAEIRRQKASARKAARRHAEFERSWYPGKYQD